MYKEMYDYYLKHQELWNTIAEVLKEEWKEEYFDNTTVDSLKWESLNRMNCLPEDVYLGCFCCECSTVMSITTSVCLCNERCIVDWLENRGCTSDGTVYNIFTHMLGDVTLHFNRTRCKDESKLDELVSLCHKIAELPFRYQKELEEELKGENEDERSRTE